MVYWERPTELKFDEMYARGVTLDDLYRHWLFVTEYQWQIMLGECQGANKAIEMMIVNLLDVQLEALYD